MDLLQALSDRDWASMNTLEGVPEELVYAVKSRQAEQALGARAVLKIGVPLILAVLVVPPFACLALGFPSLAIVWAIVGGSLLIGTVLGIYLGDIVGELRTIADVTMLCEKHRRETKTSQAD